MMSDTHESFVETVTLAESAVVTIALNWKQNSDHSMHIVTVKPKQCRVSNKLRGKHKTAVRTYDTHDLKFSLQQEPQAVPGY